MLEEVYGKEKERARYECGGGMGRRQRLQELLAWHGPANILMHVSHITNYSKLRNVAVELRIAVSMQLVLVRLSTNTYHCVLTV